jgi:3-oxoacyl-[acyl-carrier-protein] synthase-3
MKQVYINRVEHYLPPEKETNKKILKLSGVRKGKIIRMIKKIGIVSRRIAGKNIFSNDLALKAGKKVLKYIAPSKVDYIIFCTNTPEYSLPTNACLLQDRLGLSQDIGAFDAILACSGYVYSLSIAKSLIVSNQAKNIILITSDTYSKFIKKTNASTRILFGDGSSASLISSTKNKNSLNIKNFIYGTDGSGYKNAVINNFGSRYWENQKVGGNYLDLNGPGIYDFALKKVPKAVNDFLKKNATSINKIDFFIFHQANEFIVRNLQTKLKIPNNKVLMNMSHIGNTSSSSIPIVLSKYFDKIPRNKKILLIGFGGGLSWGLCSLKS